MNFERGKDPLRSMGIGHSQKREFTSIIEAAEWALLFPAEYTDGQITKWTREMLHSGKLEIPSHANTGWLQMVKWMKNNIQIPELMSGPNVFSGDTIGLKDAKAIVDLMREMIPVYLMKEENLMANYKTALRELYDHVGFKEDRVVYPIDDATEYFWMIDGSSVRFADTEEKLHNEEAWEYYQDDIYQQRFYNKWVYEGKDLTMIFCDSHVDGMKWFRVFSNTKRIK